MCKGLVRSVAMIPTTCLELFVNPPDVTSQSLPSRHKMVKLGENVDGAAHMLKKNAASGTFARNNTFL
jgi:hypothetical protein